MARRSFVLPNGRRDNPSSTPFHRYSIRADTVQQLSSIPMKAGLSSGRPSSTPEQGQLAAEPRFV
jgi:hypothetical protein